MSEHDDSYEPHHESSPTDHVLSELQLYGYRPFADEPDGRPLPEGNQVAGAIADIFDALTSRRPYKKAWSFDDAVGEMEKMVVAGKLDGDCVAAIRKHRELITTITERYVDVDA